MQPFPHCYAVAATAEATTDVALESNLESRFGATNAIRRTWQTRWSSETLFVAAVVDCFVLTFRVVTDSLKITTRLDAEIEVRLTCPL